MLKKKNYVVGSFQGWRVNRYTGMNRSPTTICKTWVKESAENDRILYVSTADSNLLLRSSFTTTHPLPLACHLELKTGVLEIFLIYAMLYDRTLLFSNISPCKDRVYNP